MIFRVLFVFSVTVLIGIEGKPVNKNDHAILKLKLTKEKTHQSIPEQISAKSITEDELELRIRHILSSIKKIHNSRRLNSVIFEPKSLPAGGSEMNEGNEALKSVLREKRSLPLKEMSRDQDPHVDQLKKFNEEDDYDEDDLYIDDDDESFNGRHTAAQSEKHQKHSQPKQMQQSKFGKSDDYRDFAFDTTDTDQFNEDDDLLQRYYGRHPAVRRAAYGDYDSFSDLMHSAAGESDSENRFVKRLHYGNQDSFLNDDVNDEIDEEHGGNDEYDDNDEYESYDDY